MSGWTHKQRKLRDKIRAEFKAETGKEFTHKDFIFWLLDKGYITKAWTQIGASDIFGAPIQLYK